MKVIDVRVCIESPLRGDVERNTRYADACMLDSLNREEAPFLGHLLYPRVLDDADPVQRARGIQAHLAWLRRSEMIVVYEDLGVTDGMQAAITLAEELRLPVARRKLGEDWEARFAPHRTQGV